MALTKKQRQLAGNILQYVIISEIMDENKIKDDEELEVMNEMFENLSEKVGHIDRNFEDLGEIIEYVKSI